MRRPGDHRTQTRGFTLVEILAALLFLALVVPVVMGALIVSNRTSLLAERGAVAGELAENKLNEMLIGNTWTAAPATSGDFGADRPGYRWTIGTSGWTNDTVNHMTELSADVFYTVQGREYNVHLSTLVDPNAGKTATAAATPTTTGTAK